MDVQIEEDIQGLHTGWRAQPGSYGRKREAQHIPGS